MGIYADAAIWAEINGRDPSDMTPEDYMEFYGEREREVRPAQKHRCICGKKLHSRRALSDHRRDKGCS